MTATFLIELDVEDDTDLTSIATELDDVITDNYHLEVLSVKPWKRETLAVAVTSPAAAPPQ